MPPTQNDRLTPTEYLLFNDMVTRIRTLEYIATQHFFNADSARRADLVRKVKQRVMTAHRLLFPVPAAGNSGDANPAGVGPGIAPAGIAPAGIAPTVFVPASRCYAPYCPSSNGTCEFCGFDEILEHILAQL